MSQDQPELLLDDTSGLLQVTARGHALLASPPDGLWSIATGWRNGWPADWHHAVADGSETAGAWTVAYGHMDLPLGTWRLRDACRPRGRVIECVRRWEWTGTECLPGCTLSVRWLTPARQPAALLPGILYHGNPSGAASGRVPVFNGTPGEEAIYEEHRFPVPFASLEWVHGDGRFGAALHTVPSPVPGARLPDQWWSLGVRMHGPCAELTLLSGPCASNGRRSVVKACQSGFLPYDHAYLTVAPGTVIEKRYFLEAYPVEQEGSGFRRPLRTAIELWRPFSADGLPTFAEITRAKYRYALSRWTESGDVAGFRKYPDRDTLVMGWCGQAAAPGYALQVLAAGLQDPRAVERVQKSLDLLASAPFYEDGFHTWFDPASQTWSRTELLSQGQAMLNLARAIRVGRSGPLCTCRWEAFLRQACDVHSSRILADRWKPVSTNEGFFIAPLCAATVLFDTDRYRTAAEKAGLHYAARHVPMREPYWGGTLDAQCEDKEGAYAALQGFLALYELTRDRQYLDWACHACDVVLSYVVIWNIDLPPGRLRDHAFQTRGWTVVSPQNQHIDAYGVLMAPDIYRLGKLLDREDMQQLALLMVRSCGQLMDPFGSHGEQPQHTNYAQRGQVDSAFGLRGGYAEDWTVFWLTAHFLNAAAQFAELGVEVWA